MEKQKVRILVVEDREENRRAATDYFVTKSDLEVEFATNLKEAIAQIEQKVYGGAILDIEFPRDSGREPEELGIELGMQMDMTNGKYRIPHVYLTAGDHHGPIGRIFTDEFCYEHGVGAITTRSKSTSEAWQEACRQLEQPFGLQPIWEAKLRYQRATGKTVFIQK